MNHDDDHQQQESISSINTKPKQEEPPAKPSSSITNKKNKGKKRSRTDTKVVVSSSLTREERHIQERQSYYRRLLHSCTKHVHKSLKEAKKLERTKLARNLKKVNGSSSGKEAGATSERRSDDKDDDKDESSDEERSSDDEQEHVGSNREADSNPPAKTSIAARNKLEKRYRDMKGLDVEPIVAIVLRRLGIVQLDPDFVSSSSAPTSSGAATAPATGSASTHATHVVERLLKHNRMRTCIEKWNEEVTEYRRWCLRQEETRHGDTKRGSAVVPAKSSQKKDTKKKKRRRAEVEEKTSAAATAASFEHSVFARLGGGTRDDESEGSGKHSDDNDYYGSGGHDDKAKKNRPGQRARKAQAEAIRAKEQGVPITHSLNWREPKKDGTSGGSHHHRSWSEQRHAHRNLSTSEDTGGADARAPQKEDDEKAHPSWQAKSLKANTGGIVAFQGKKITFD